MPILARDIAERAAFEAFLSATQRGDLDAVRLHFQLPDVLASLAIWDGVYRAHRANEPVQTPVCFLPRPWFVDGNRILTTSSLLCGSDVDVFRWFFAREQLELLGESLRSIVKTVLDKFFSDNHVVWREKADVVFESPLFHEILDDKERAWILADLLIRAMSNRSVEWIDFLIAYGADPTGDRNDGSPLLATRDGRTEVLGVLLKHGASIDRVDLVTQVARQYRYADLRGWLVRGADARRVCPQNGSVLHHAAINYGVENVRYLLNDSIVDVDVRDHNGATPLMLVAEDKSYSTATSSPKHDVLRLLLDGGAELQAVDSRGRSILHCAIRGWNASCLRLILERGVDPNVRDDQGATPIFALVMYVQKYVDNTVKDMLDVLLEFGADPYLCDNAGVSTIDLLKMRESGRRYMAENPAVFKP